MIQRSIILTALLAGACSDPDDREPCLTDELADIEVQPDENGLDTMPVTDSVTITGIATADLRIARLQVGGADVMGQLGNYETWTITRTVAQMQRFRDDDSFAMLPITVEDVCGRSGYEFPPIRVAVDAPAGSNAEGLMVGATATQLIELDDGTQIPECYLPADGTGIAAITVTADASAAGVTVSLSSPVDGPFLGANESSVVLQATEGSLCPTDTPRCAASDGVFFRPQAAGRLSVAAQAGRSFDVDADNELRAVEGPRFEGAQGTIAPGTPATVQVKTAGRLRQCDAETSNAAMVSVRYEQTDLTERPVDFNDATCGQEATFSVTFGPNAPVGQPVTITCTDTYQQSHSVSLSAGAVEDE